MSGAAALAASALAQGRVLAESLMVDACLIRHVTGVTTDDLSAQVTNTYATVYAGPCRVQVSGAGAMGQRTDAGEVSVVVLRLELQLPVATSTGVSRGDVVTLTTSTNDPDLLTRTFRVHDLAHKTHATARRLQIEEVT